MSTEALGDWVSKHWEQMKASLLEGRYEPQAVRRVDIPKPGGGIRTLGIPTMCDRLIQQAIHQVLGPLWEREFSPHSYGFRPRRSTHGAVKAARAYVAQGHRWVVDIDLEKFFDKVNHDILMARIARRIRDKTLLRLIRQRSRTLPQRSGPQSSELHPRRPQPQATRLGGLLPAIGSHGNL